MHIWVIIRLIEETSNGKLVEGLVDYKFANLINRIEHTMNNQNKLQVC